MTVRHADCGGRDAIDAFPGGRSFLAHGIQNHEHIRPKPSALALGTAPHSLRRAALAAVLQPPHAGAVRLSVLLLVSAALGADHVAAPLRRLSGDQQMNNGQSINGVAMAVFIGFFALVTVLGFIAARWKRGDLTQLHEWGLGGRQFGTIISWFLVGGDFYTAYTVIAVPALVYSVGAYGFFALPYTIIVYPFVFAVMPKLWKVAHAKNHITAADVVLGAHGSRGLELAVALTGMVATMPYIALQLIGMQVVIKGLGVAGEMPLIVAFVILALYTYASGLRAPAMIAFVKDIMIYIVVIAAIWLIPTKLGGYAQVFDSADKFFAAKGGVTGIVLQPSQFIAYA